MFSWLFGPKGSPCQVEKGMLFWKKPCGKGSLGRCDACKAHTCGKHAHHVPGGILCATCWQRMGSPTDYSSAGYAAGPSYVYHTRHQQDDTSFRSSDSSSFDDGGSDASASYEDDSSSSSEAGGSWNDPS